MKTKRWVEAKKISYDGDDWGDDEYGEYDHGDEEEEDNNEKSLLQCRRCRL